ncbi:MAG: rod shape-determining protein [Paludibacteraceae bacterium]|nr:rod shape-determining protein [Paludibacteraceae bacterium]MBQ2607987.1 rod shape-determining protein [Paludibacteraceae bacterium]
MAKKQKEISADSLPLVAIDLGSDSVRAMAAQRVDNDLFHILGVEKSRKFMSGIERGVVVQTSNVGYMISEVLRLLANRIGINNLPTAFVSVGGRSMRIVHVSSKRDQIHPRPVSKQLLGDMERECKQKIERHYPEIIVLGLVPAYFVLDGVEQEQAPKEDQAVVLVEAHFIAFYAKRELDEQLQKSFVQAGRPIESSFVRPEALLSAFACVDGDEVLQHGCAVLDFGAQTTTLTVFKRTTYLFNIVLPQGGQNITKAIAQQGISEATAEQLKCKYGFAAPSLVEKNLRMSINDPVNGVVEFTSAALASIIEQKLEEILSPLMQEFAKYEERVETLYITGGGSMLNGLDTFVQQHTKVKVLYGAHDTLLDSTTEPAFFEPGYSSLVGTLLLGSDYRLEHRGEPVKKSGWLERFKQETLGLFEDQEY